MYYMCVTQIIVCVCGHPGLIWGQILDSRPVVVLTGKIRCHFVSLQLNLAQTALVYVLVRV